MTANELRIGNLIYFKGIEIAITEIKQSEILQILKPIPLTDEWLIKFGFTKTKDNYIIANKDFSIKFDEDEYNRWAVSNNQSDAYCYIIKYLDYVHELQNLYFALTNEELILNK